jgi:hypothetical protein
MLLKSSIKPNNKRRENLSRDCSPINLAILYLSRGKSIVRTQLRALWIIKLRAKVFGQIKTYLLKIMTQELPVKIKEKNRAAIIVNN